MRYLKHFWQIDFSLRFFRDSRWQNTFNWDLWFGCCADPQRSKRRFRALCRLGQARKWSVPWNSLFGTVFLWYLVYVFIAVLINKSLITGKWIEFDDDNPIPQREEDIVKLSGGGNLNLLWNSNPWFSALAHKACVCQQF